MKSIVTIKALHFSFLAALSYEFFVMSCIYLKANTDGTAFPFSFIAPDVLLIIIIC